MAASLPLRCRRCVTWYHSSPCLSTPRMPMWPTWWWPQEFMQPEMLRSMLADVVQVVQIVEALLDGRGDRDRLGVGQRAEVAAGAADDVGQQADVRRGQAGRLAPSARRRRGRCCGTSASTRFCSWETRTSPKLNSSARSATCSSCSAVTSPGAPPMGLQRQRHGGVAGDAVAAHVALVPGGEGLVLVQVAASSMSSSARMA